MVGALELAAAAVSLTALLALWGVAQSDADSSGESDRDSPPTPPDEGGTREGTPGARDASRPGPDPQTATPDTTGPGQHPTVGRGETGPDGRTNDSPQANGPPDPPSIPSRPANTDGSDQRRELGRLVDRVPMAGFTPAEQRDLRSFLRDEFIHHLRVPPLFYRVFANLRVERKPGPRAMFQPHPNRGGVLYLSDTQRHPQELKPAVAHELSHALMNAYGFGIQEGKAVGYDRSYNWQGGIPNWRFNPMDQPWMYLLKDSARRTTDIDELEQLYRTRIRKVRENGYTQVGKGGSSHFPVARDGRPDETGSSARTHRQLLVDLVNEANIAWYVVARLAHDNRWDVTMATYHSGYMATNAGEALATATELCFNYDRGRSVSFPELMYRHPYLLGCLLDIYNPTEQVASILEDHGRPLSGWRSAVRPG